MSLSKSDWKQLNKRFGEMDKRFGEMDKRFDKVDKRFEKSDKRPDNIVKSVVSQVDKIITTQTVRLLNQNAELEQKYEDKLTQTKNEFFDKVDPVLKEVQSSREARTLVENRLEALEEIHQTGKHSITTN